MNWNAYKQRHRELHIAYHAAKRAGDRERMNAVEIERDQLEDEHTRRYPLDEKHVARVGMNGLRTPWLTIETLDDAGCVHLYITEFGALSSKAMLQLARIQRHIERYMAGDFENLRDEMPTAPYSCPRHQCAAEGGAVNCLDCVPVTPVE